MSVLCCRVPDFLIALAVRRQPAWTGQPLALLGPDDRIWAASPAARRSGVQVAMRPPQAQVACPDLLIRPLDVAGAQAAQAALLETLAAWALPVEPLEWGAAYVGVAAVARTASSVQPLAADAGRRLRRTLGEALTPAVGWDSGKFTARAAAAQAPPGRMRLVDQADEVNFLAPLPVALLPLPPAQLLQLHWLGIATLGQFARLPAAGVWQRFGAAGRLAQQWAQGRDDRPVQPAAASAPLPIRTAVDPPTGRLAPVVAAVMAELQPVLAQQAACLAGIRHLRVTLCFAVGADRSLDLTFVEPASQAGRIQAALVQQLGGFAWPAEVEAVQWSILATGELAVRQLDLFAPAAGRLLALDAIAQQLASRYGPLLHRGRLLDEQHPLPERRARLEACSSDVAPVA